MKIGSSYAIMFTHLPIAQFKQTQHGFCYSNTKFVLLKSFYGLGIQTVLLPHNLILIFVQDITFAIHNL